MSKATNLWLLWIGTNLTFWMGGFAVQYASEGRPFSYYLSGALFGFLLMSYEIFRIHNGLKTRSFALTGMGIMMVIPATFFGTLLSLLLPSNLSEFTQILFTWVAGFASIYPIAWHLVGEKQNFGLYNLTPEKVNQMQNSRV